MEQAFAGLGGTHTVILVGGVIVAAAFFSPTIVAVARGRGAGTPTFLMNLVGWTGVGWLVAWLVAFRDYRRLVYLPPSYADRWARDQAPSPAAVSADGRYLWDGSAWRPLTQ